MQSETTRDVESISAVPVPLLTDKMGLFSRKDKAPKAGNIKTSLNHQQSNGSLASGGSSLKSPDPTSYTNRTILNRTSAGTTSTGPGTPLTPFSPAHTMASLPRIDLPRAPDPQLDPAGYLRSLPSVRERAQIVTEKALRNELRHFDVDFSKFADVVRFVSNIIKVSLGYRTLRCYPWPGRVYCRVGESGGPKLVCLGRTGEQQLDVMCCASRVAP